MANNKQKAKHSRPVKKVQPTNGKAKDKSGKSNNLTKLYQKMPLDSMIGKASRKEKSKPGLFTRRGD